MIKKFYLSILTLTALLCFGAGNAWGDEMTVADKTNYNSYCPFYGNWGDAYQRCQVIYLSSELAEMSGKDITGMTFYLKSKPTKAWSGSEYHILLSEVTASSFSGSWNTETTGTEVLACSSLDGTSGTLTLTFTTPYTYNGGNLLFELQDKGTGEYATSSFYGDSNLGNRSVSNYSSTSYASVSATNRAFLPKTTFTYESGTPVTCPKPSALTQGAVNSSSATFTWTAGGDETSWQWICLPAETAVDWSSSAVQTATSATATATDLSAQTSYKFYVRADCGSEQSAEVSKAFKTPCVDYAIADLPLDQNFNSLTAGTGLIPDCWSKVANGNYPYIYSSSGVDGSKCLYFSGGASATSSIIILPHFEAPTNTLVISLAYKNNSTNSTYAQFKIGYMTNPEDASSFVPLKALTRYNTWTEENKFALTSAPANSYIAIQYSGGSSTGSAYLDNIKVAIPSSCTDPSAVSAVAASATSATVSWTENGSAEAWNIQYSTDNFATHTDVNNVTTNPYTLTGLTANTTYKVRVQADCGSEQSDWVASSAFATPCEAVNGIGWSEDFETAASGSGVIPDCWQKITNNNSYPQVSNSSYYQKEGSTKCLYFYGGAAGTAEQIAILPSFNENTNTLYVTLDYSQAYEYYGSSYDYSTSEYGQLSIGYITNPTDASTFVAQETLPRVNAYSTASAALTDAPAGSYVAIRYAGGENSGYLFVDNISISALPSCLTPSGLGASPISSTSAQVSWTSSASAWNLQYSVKGANDWTAVNNVTENPYTLASLVASTDYEIQIQAVCGSEETSNWSSSVYFSTPCDVVSMPFSQNFNSLNTAGQIPSCWDNEEGTTTSANYKWSYNANGHEGACVRFDSYNNASDNDNYLKTPEIAVTEAALLTFWYKNPDGGDYSVYYSLDGGTTKTEIITGLTAAAWTKYSAELPAACVGHEVTIVFKGTSNWAYGDAYLSLDDVSVEAVPSCLAPSAPVASAITANTAQLAWTTGGTVSAWKLQYSTDGANWIDANGGATVTNPYTLSGLSANTVYYARVKSVCGENDESPWSEASAAFQTACEAALLPFSEDFSTALTCWTLTNCVANTGVSDGKFMFYYTYNPSQYLITPEIDTESKQVIVEFDYSVSSSSYPETFQVGYSTTTNEVSAFTWGETVTATNLSDNILKYSEALPAGVKYVSIQHLSYDKYFLYIDNFTVEELPACPKVKTNSLAASSISANSATISWNVAYNESAWNLQYKAEDGEWSDAIAVATTPSCNLTGLNANTVYYVRVQANCGGDGTSEYTDGTFSFQTECEALAVDYGNEWNCGFEAEEGATVNTVPSCWKAVLSDGDPQYAYALVDNAGAKTGSQNLHIEVYHNNNAIAVLPMFTNDLSELQISFAYKNDQTSSNYGQLELGYYLNGTFTLIGDKLTRVTSYKDMTVDMPENVPAGAKIAFRVVGSGGYRRTNAYIDDVVVGKKAVVVPQNEDNGAALEALKGQTLDVQIGRTFFKGVGNNTICLPFSLPTLDGTPLEGGTLLAFKYGYVENGELLLRVYPAESMEAGVPYLISWEDGDNIVDPVFKSVMIAAAQGKSVGENNDVQFVGIFAPEIFPQDDKTKLFMLTNDQIAWSGVEANVANSLKSFRAYFQTNTAVGATSSNAPIRHGMPARIVMQEQVATGMENVQGVNKAVKLLENDQVVIIRNGVKYNLQGQVISK